MGERDAVRINSGESVTHSDPGLTVGPTLPLTTGRKPGARPPSPRVRTPEPDGFKEHREAGLCQPKSGQGFGDRVPESVGREAPALSLDDFTTSQLREFFEMLDRWDREAHEHKIM